MSADSVTLRHSVYFQDLTDATCWWCTLCLPGPMKRIKYTATTSFSAILTHAKTHGVDGNWKALIAPAAPGHAAVYEQAKVAHAAAAGRVVTAAAKRPKQQTTLVTRMCAFASRESVARVFCTTPIAFVTLRHHPEVFNTDLTEDTLKVYIVERGIELLPSNMWDARMALSVTSRTCRRCALGQVMKNPSPQKY